MELKQNKITSYIKLWKKLWKLKQYTKNNFTAKKVKICITKFTFSKSYRAQDQMSSWNINYSRDRTKITEAHIKP